MIYFPGQYFIFVAAVTSRMDALKGGGKKKTASKRPTKKTAAKKKTGAKKKTAAKKK